MDMAGEKEDTGTPPSPPPTPAPTNTGFSQEQVNDAAGRARNEGRQAAQRDLLETLGVKDIDEAKGLLGRLKDLDDKQKDELTKAAEKATKAESELARLQTDHTKQTLDNRVATSVLKKLLGDNAAVLEKASVIRRLIEVDAKAEDGDIDKAVEELSKTMPELFVVGAGTGGDGNGKPPARPKVEPPGRPIPGTPGSGNSTPRDSARTRLHERHPRLDRPNK